MKVLVFPKDNNPYQELLYSNIRNLGCECKYLTSPVYSHSIWLFLILIPQLIIYRLKGFRILHLHWLYDFTIPTDIKIFRSWPFNFIIFLHFINFLLITKFLGYRIVWTIHNLLPHNKVFLNDVLAIKILASLSKIKIVFSASTIKEMNKFGFNTNNIHIIPMGYYNNFHGVQINQTSANDTSSIKLLFFGKIERYKGLVELLKAFKELKQENMYLTIAGECKNKYLEKELKKLSSDKVLLDCRYITNKEIPVLFSKHDIAIFPFTAITNSSSILLAMGYKKPLIYPNLPELLELPKEVGFNYVANNVFSLKACLTRVSQTNKETLRKMGDAGFAYVKRIASWEVIGKKTFELYKFLMS